MSYPDSSHLDCPNCRKSDWVRKVSAEVTAGTATGVLAGPSVGLGHTFGGAGGTTLAGGYTTLAGSSQTVLSQRLAPPGLRRRKSVGVAVVLFFLFWPAFLFYCRGFARGFLYLLVYAGTIVLLAKVSEGFVALLVAVSLFIIVDGFLGVGRSWVSGPVKGKRGDVTAAYQKAFSLWNQLYYCHRCDGVFLPGHSPLISPEQMQQAMYAP